MRRKEKNKWKGVFDFPTNSERLRYLCFCVGEIIDKDCKWSVARKSQKKLPPSCYRNTFMLIVEERKDRARESLQWLEWRIWCEILVYPNIIIIHPSLPPPLHRSKHPFITSSVQASTHSLILPKLGLFSSNKLKNYLPSKVSSIKKWKDFLNSLLSSSGRNQLITLYDFSSSVKPKKHQWVKC